jgi:hypothetical protein
MLFFLFHYMTDLLRWQARICLEMIDEVDSLHVERIIFSGLLLFRYYRLLVLGHCT